MIQKQSNLLLSRAFCLTVFFVTAQFLAPLLPDKDTDTVEEDSFEHSAQPDLLQCPRPLLRTLQHYSYVYIWHTSLIISFVFL